MRFRRAAGGLALAGILTACSTSAGWEHVALATTALDMATTAQILARGGHETNPVLGTHASTTRILLVNLALMTAIWVASRHWPRERRERLWRAVAILRAAPLAWNTYQLAGRSDR